MLREFFLFLCVGMVFSASGGQAAVDKPPPWKAGVAKVAITPEQLMWMSGYSARTKPAEGKLHDLWAKALVLEDPKGERGVLITLDLVGIDRRLSLAVCKEIQERYYLPREAIVLASSHTHSGPVIRGNLDTMYNLDDVQRKYVKDYAKTLQANLVAVVGAAVRNLAPARVEWGTGQAGFAVNRRNNKEADVPRLREKGLLKGPYDHDVPVLAVRDLEGKLRGVVFGYACHATVFDFYLWSGDYPGFAQINVEKAHPGAIALFWAGCGADQNPIPRRQTVYAEEYGRQLAQSVDAVLGRPMTPLAGALDMRYREIELPFAELPTREQVEQNANSKNRYEAARAKFLLEKIDKEGSLSPVYPYPVQVWKLGPELVFVTLGGEVVVDYSLRLKKELSPGKTWVAGYANDVMAYIPSLRVLKEGGYEGGGAMVYYGLPAVWGPAVEERIVAAVHEMVK